MEYLCDGVVSASIYLPFQFSNFGVLLDYYFYLTKPAKRNSVDRTP